jgi:hypothetical protein
VKAEGFNPAAKGAGVCQSCRLETPAEVMRKSQRGFNHRRVAGDERSPKACGALGRSYDR